MADAAPLIPPIDLYRIAVEEYRWQAGLNWTRTQYLLGLNVLILVAGTTFVRPVLAVATLSFGAVAAVLSAGAVRTQHGYYRAARDHLPRLELDLQIPERQRLDTTSTQGGRPRRVSIHQVVYLLLAAIVVADVFGVVLGLG